MIDHLSKPKIKRRKRRRRRRQLQNFKSDQSEWSGSIVVTTSSGLLSTNNFPCSEIMDTKSKISKKSA
ncbi:Sh2B Adapter Protein 1 [Manis pentadactyla]|nr:Sh2B Adapter Protein 1 [Manis pentadactyla]